MSLSKRLPVLALVTALVAGSPLATPDAVGGGIVCASADGQCEDSPGDICLDEDNVSRLDRRSTR